MVKGLNRRGFLKIMGAVPLIGPMGLQQADRLAQLKEISLRIMCAPVKLTAEIGYYWNHNWFSP